MASADPKRIIVTESRCHACNDHTFVVHHQTFPELRMEAMSAERAARYLANRLEDAIHIVADAAPARRSGWRSTTSEPSWTER